MNFNPAGTRLSLSGVAVLAACACGTSSRIAQIGNTFGYSEDLHTVHSIFVTLGSVLIVAGLWRQARRAAVIGLAAVALLFAGELLAPPMSVKAGEDLTSLQIFGFIASLLAAIGLVAAFFRAYPSHRPAAALTAMSGAVMAVGCNCCLVTMALAAPGRILLPDQAWAGASLTFYAIGATLMAVGLARLGGLGPAVLAVAGQAFVYFWLELPYSALPAFSIRGVDGTFLIKYPMMFAGALVVMTSFVLAYRSQENRVAAAPTLAPQTFGD